MSDEGKMTPKERAIKHASQWFQQIGNRFSVDFTTAMLIAIEEAEREARFEALEEAAKIADHHATAHSYHASPIFIGEAIAAAIREKAKE
jgi:hypothetical protein